MNALGVLASVVVLLSMLDATAACGDACHDKRVCFDPLSGAASDAGPPTCPAASAASDPVKKRLFQSQALCSVDSGPELEVEAPSPPICCYGPADSDCYVLASSAQPCASVEDASVILKKQIPVGTVVDRHVSPVRYGCCYQTSVRDNGLRPPRGARQTLPGLTATRTCRGSGHPRASSARGGRGRSSAPLDAGPLRDRNVVMMRLGTGGVALQRIPGGAPGPIQPRACLGSDRQDCVAWRGVARTLPLVTALSALLSSGCLSSNTYNEPRALPARELSVGVAPELYRAHAVREAPGTAFPRRTVDAHGYSALPSTAFVRVGLGKGFEVGGRVNGASVAGAEGKLELARGRFDVAIGPSVQAGRESYVIADLPLLLGWNVGDAVIVFSPAFDYAKNAPAPTSSKSTLPFPEGALGKATLGVRVKPPGSLAIQPEVSALRSLRDPASTLVTVGIALLYHGGHADEGTP